MPLIIKKLVPVYAHDADVPKKYKNLRKPQHVTTFKHPYPTIPQILMNEYGLKADEKIIVYWTREISTPRFNRYRMKFRKVYSGTVEKYAEAIKGGSTSKSHTLQDTPPAKE
jgi:hypothetical protein